MQGTVAGDEVACGAAWAYGGGPLFVASMALCVLTCAAAVPALRRLAQVETEGLLSSRSVIRFFVYLSTAFGLTALLHLSAGFGLDPQWLTAGEWVVVVTCGAALVQAWFLVRRKAGWQDTQSSLPGHESGQQNDLEERLWTAEQRLDLTLAGMRAGLLVTGPGGKVTQLNGVAQRLTGWSEREAIGQPFSQVCVGEQLRSGGRVGEFGEQPGEPQSNSGAAHRLTLTARDGTVTAVEMQTSLTTHRDGSVDGSMVVMRDMSELQKIVSTRDRLAAIVDSSVDAIIGKTLDGHITDWNAAAQHVFGYTAAQAVGQSIQMLIPAERQQEEVEILRRLAAGESVPAFDTVRRRQDGHMIDVSLAISPIRNHQGQIIGASKIIRDRTQERKAIEALRDSEERLRLALEAGEVGEWEYDFQTRSTQRSLRHDQCYGYARMLPEWNMGMFEAHLHPDDLDWVKQEFDLAMTLSEPWRMECRVIWPDKSVHWIAVSGTWQFEGDRPVRMFGLISDVTTKRAVEDMRLHNLDLENENHRIQQANKLKSLFLANMSHELRTPLNAIIGFADLLRSGMVSRSQQEHDKFLGHIGSSGRHLLQLINDVLDLSKVESGKFEFYPEAIDMTRVFQEVADVMQTAVMKKRIRLKQVVDLGARPIELDQARLKQVLFNYLSNAIKFTPQGGEVTVRATDVDDDHFRIEVEDSGIGIAEQDLNLLFSEFQQLDSGFDRRHEGTGLGLALTRRLVEAQGGRVGVRSAPGVGSTFSAVLNRIHGTDPAIDAHATAQENPQRLLVIEDDVQAQARMHQAMANIGFQVDCVATAQQALDRAQQARYAGLMLDLDPPGERGLGLLSKIRRSRRSGDCEVIAISLGVGGGRTANFAIANVLAKPLNKGELGALAARLGPRDERVVMVVDDDPVAGELIQAALEDIKIQGVVFESAMQALSELDLLNPSAIILDLMMPGMSGLELLDKIRRRPASRDTPVYLWTSLNLSLADYERLTAAATVVADDGGGALTDLLISLAQWRPASAIRGWKA